MYIDEVLQDMTYPWNNNKNTIKEETIFTNPHFEVDSLHFLAH